MKKINVSKDACIGCGACVAIDSEHFEFNDEGLSTVISNENLDSENLKNAIESCPTSAISIKEENDCNCKETCKCGCQDGKECTCDDDCDCNDDSCNDCEHGCHCDKE